jgi:hypothetical protein
MERIASKELVHQGTAKAKASPTTAKASNPSEEGIRAEKIVRSSSTTSACLVSCGPSATSSASPLTTIHLIEVTLEERISEEVVVK